MGRRKLLLTSNVHRFEGSWPNASLSDEDLKWARRNLVKGTDGKCEFERRRGFRRDRPTTSIRVSLPKDWAWRVNFKTGEVHPWVRVQLGARYDFREKFNEALNARDPELAPHVMFRRLTPGNDAVALGFIRDCGPLFLDDMTRNPIVWIDLNDFWRRHARFVAIVRLYETLDDCERLRNALASMVENLQSLNEAGPQEIGKIPDTGRNTPFIRYVYLHEPQEFGRVDQDGDLTWDHQRLRDHAREIIQAELILQTFEGIRSGWVELDEEEGFGFRPTRIATSLSAAIWEMFGLDTWRGYGWRSCRECAKYFYPSQVNSECCCPEHQALWSKRQYAKKRRESEKLAAFKRRRQTRKHD